MIKHTLILFILFIVSQKSFSQFTGGNHDGHGNGLLTQSNCSQLVSNFAFYGGNTDGYSGGLLTQSNCTQLVSDFVFYGGNADGYSGGVLTQSNCTQLVSDFVFYGGNADGYSGGVLAQSNCPPLISNFVYYGGNSDGYSGGLLTQSNCPPLNSDFVYYGGNNDGVGYGSLTQTTCTNLFADYVFYGGVNSGFSKSPSTVLILSQPASSLVCAGTTALFSLDIQGQINNYAWQLSTNSGSSWLTISTGTSYSGISTKSLTITGVPASITGYRFRNLATYNCLTSITSSSAIVTVNPNGTWAGTINSDWMNSGNWCGLPPTTTSDNAFINSTAIVMPIITTSSVNINSISIGSSASLTLAGSNTLSINGSFFNNGQFLASSGKVRFIGNTVQLITGLGSNFFNDLDIINTVGVISISTAQISGTMTLGSNAKYTSSSTGLIQIKSTAFSTGRISTIPSGATVGGMVRVERYVPAKPTLRLMSSPVSGARITDWKNSIPVSGIGGTSNGFDVSVPNINTVWYFNEGINAPTTYRYVGAPNASMTLTVGSGFRVYVRGDRSTTIPLTNTITLSSTTMYVTNVLNQGNINLPVTYTNYNAPFRDGTNLVGNPYPSEIDWDAPGWTKTNIDNALYMWDPNLDINGAYYYYVGGIASPARLNPSVIASSQGFFVKANAANPVLQITESVKTIAGHTANFRITNNDPQDLFRIQLSDSISTDETVVRFLEGSTLKFDKDYDAYKMFNSKVNIFSNPIQGIDLSINTLPPVVNDFTLPLSVYSTKIGRHSIIVNGIDNTSTDLSFYLKDDYLGVYSDLQSSKSYEFQISKDVKSSGQNRFSLVVLRGQVVTGISANEKISPKMKIYPNPGNGENQVVDFYNFNEEEFQFQIKDIGGYILVDRVVNCQGPIHRIELKEFNALSSGVYFVTAISGNTRLTEKVVLTK